MSPRVPRVRPVVDKHVKYGERLGASDAVQLAAIGLEAEFTVILDGKPVKPEDVFRSPRRIIRGPLMHRTGRSYHLPTGGAVYFDTGVIEIATPTIELGPGCAARAGRSLWESIRFLRTELDEWERRNNRKVELAGFSAHYNISFDIPDVTRGHRTVERLAWLLTHIIPFPVMMLAANRKSTGIGVRPRGNRVEITADFTPDASLMIASATAAVGIVRQVMTWESFELSELEAHGVPRLATFAPGKASSRKGWVARFDSFDKNPFLTDVDLQRWKTKDGPTMSLRELGREVIRVFRPAIERYADDRSMKLIDAVMSGEVTSLLDLDDRPAAYESVGRLCTWADLFPVRALDRSRYERVFIRAIARVPLRIDGRKYIPTGMKGWSRVVFRRDGDGTKHAFSLDFLLKHLDRWDIQARREARLGKVLSRRLERRV
ncbi:MAG TPA: hypothetical protein VFO55_13665 [Gemmatimonadaceae bacterium]|nr:hypothetical protein [Gemmatimonadaceae bacterium]